MIGVYHGIPQPSHKQSVVPWCFARAFSPSYMIIHVFTYVFTWYSRCFFVHVSLYHDLSTTIYYWLVVNQSNFRRCSIQGPTREEKCLRGVFAIRNEGFHQWRIPHSWLVYRGKAYLHGFSGVKIWIWGQDQVQKRQQDWN